MLSLFQGTQIQTSTVTSPVIFLQSGSNTIVIAIVAITDSYTTSYFDAMVRLMSSEQFESHIWDATTSSGLISLDVNVFDMYYSTLSIHLAMSPSLRVTLNNNRRE